MTSIVSRVPQVLSYLAATFQAAGTLGAATPPVAVYDGPVATGAADRLILWVGLDDPDADTAALAASSDRQWSGLGGQSELITVQCTAEAWSGDDTIATVRTAVYGIVAAVEALIRADTTQFGGNAMLADPGVTGADLRQNSTETGAQARVQFAIVLKAL